MAIPVYNKLVRDKIPEIIRETGKECSFSTISGEKLISALEDKLKEELGEFIDGGREIQELADILEVVDALAVQLGSSFDEVVARKKEKRKSRGGFEHGILLEWVQTQP